MDNYELYTCFHCGNTGMMKMISKHEERFGGPILDQYGICVGNDFQESMTWELFSCCVCKMVTLVRKYDDECYINPHTEERFEDIDILYPECSFNGKGVPKEIKTAFESVLKIKQIDTNICLMSIRRTLEAICLDQGAKGKNLESMVKDLVKQNTLPINMDMACWIIRKLGNSAAHLDSISIYTHHLEKVIDFTKNIINYLYTMPLEMDELKKYIENQK